MAQSTAHRVAQTEIGGYASVQQGDRQVINTINVTTAYFTLQGGHDLLHPESTSTTKVQFKDAICGRCGCHGLVRHGSGSVVTNSVAKVPDHAVRSRRAYSLGSLVAEPTQPLSAYMSLTQAQQTKAERRTSKISTSHEINPSTHELNDGSNVREASPNPFYPTSIGTTDMQGVIPSKTTNALYSQVVRKSSDP